MKCMRAECPSGRMEERKGTDGEKIKKDMRAGRAAQGQPFNLAAGEEKAKNILQPFSFLFFPGE